MSIKKFILLWVSVQVFCFAVMAAALILSTNKLQSMTGQILKDVKATEMAHQFEIAILGERREDLLWRFTGKADHHQQKAVYLDQASAIIDKLEQFGTSSGENKLGAIIENLFSRFRMFTVAEPPVSTETISSAADELLQAVEQFRDLKRMQMTNTLAISSRLNIIVDLGTISLILFILLIVMIGSFFLVKRIILPISALSEATTQFGRGEFGTRARVFRNDEFGSLCKTFNTMAENISNLQEERLNFVAAVSHDLKNPLVLVGATARRLKKKLTLPGDQTILVDRLVEQTMRMEDLVGDLMDSVQIQSGKIALKMDELELYPLVDSIQRYQAEITDSHHIVFEGKCTCRVMGDARRLERVFTNLISNAVKYSGNNSRVLIKVEQQGTNAVVSIADEGVGIPAADIHFLFQPFARLAHTRDMAKGTGLGLFSAKKIIDGHGGTIQISSEPGKGTTVAVTLPLILPTQQG